MTIEQHEARMRALSTYLDALDAAWLKSGHDEDSDDYDLECAAARVEYDRVRTEISLLSA